MKTVNSIKLNAIAASLAYSTLALSTLTFSTLAFSAMDNDYETITGWQSSLAAKFTQLDTSGNGLLLPLEASKDKAFNKKTFAAADSDGDGTIDQGEYIQYKTSMGAKNVPAATMTNESSSMSDNTNSARTTVDEPVPPIQTAEATQDNAEPNKRKVGEVLDDSVITTKAKAAIFNTPDLKTLQISVETRKGEVLLSGFVDSEVAKMKAEEVVKNVGGVKSVKNSLEVKS
jgi:osmotically-inducible protein OsmY